MILGMAGMYTGMRIAFPFFTCGNFILALV